MNDDIDDGRQRIVQLRMYPCRVAAMDLEPNISELLPELLGRIFSNLDFSDR
jgi:hypothetical protein